MFWEKYFRKPADPEPVFAPTLPLLSPVASLRPCEADGKPAVFHGWVADDRALLRINTFLYPDEMGSIHRRFRDQGLIPSGCSADVLREVVALVEYPDGSVGKVKPELIQFLDREGEV